MEFSTNLKVSELNLHVSSWIKYNVDIKKQIVED